MYANWCAVRDRPLSCKYEILLFSWILLCRFLVKGKSTDSKKEKKKGIP